MAGHGHMKDRDRYTFHIDAYSPDSIPMARLAEYLVQLAGLLGNTDSVHFLEVGDGSVQLISEVEYEAIPKVRERLSRVAALDAPDDARKRYAQLNEMLRDDNAVGSLSRDSQNVIRFPGKEIKRPKKIGPFNEPGKIDGVLVRIGGKDKTVHAQLMGHNGETQSCVVDRDRAREMAQHLFGAPLRVIGVGRWERSESAEWSLISFRADEFIVLNDDDLEDVVVRLREVRRTREESGANQFEILSELRGDDEIH